MDWQTCKSVDVVTHVPIKKVLTIGKVVATIEREDGHYPWVWWVEHRIGSSKTYENETDAERDAEAIAKKMADQLESTPQANYALLVVGLERYATILLEEAAKLRRKSGEVGVDRAFNQGCANNMETTALSILERIEPHKKALRGE